jgi:hypothetical protein
VRRWLDRAEEKAAPDMEGALGRLMLALLCMAMLIGARWYHERQVLAAGLLTHRSAGVTGRRGLRGRLSRRALAGRLSQPLYWLGLTTSAALAAQAIASFISRRMG